MDIQGDRRIFSVGNSGWGDTFFDFPWSLYNLYFYPACICTTPDVLSNDGLTILEHGPSALRRVTFKWEEDNRYEYWRIDGPVDLKADSIVSIDITEHQGVFENDGRSWKASKSRYDVLFCDLCYAAGKAITETMKSYGFTGLSESKCDAILVSRLCFLKACGMGNPEFFVSREAHEEDLRKDFKTSFADEMELLMFDM